MHLLKRFLWIAAVTVALALPQAGLAQSGLAESGPAEGDPRAVIGAQIEAFRADDFETAFGFAAPGIRRMFRTPENFGAMVRQGYPMVWRPAEVRYGASETRGAALLQQVIVTDGAGRVHVLEYRMEPAGDSWRIAGVRILQAAGVGA